MSKVIMVTGATGYIGSHICKHLKTAGYQVIGVDRVRREHALKHIDVFIEADYASVETFRALAQYQLIESVIHCAATSLVGPSVIDPLEYYTNNVGKTIIFLEVLKALPNKPSIVFSGSASVYGNATPGLISEDSPQAPESPYAQSKAMCEQIILDSCKAYGLRAVIHRYFNACGADIADAELGQEAKATHIIARLLEARRDNIPFTLYGDDYNTHDGTCVRDYVHVDDIAEAHVKSVQYLANGGETRIINLGTGTGYSNREVINAVTALLGPIQVTTGERRAGDVDHHVASNQLAQDVLGWAPVNSDLETIIKSAWAWHNR